MPPAVQESPGIKWNEVTWYSRLGAIILFVGVIPTLTFYIGAQYQAVRDESSVSLESNAVAKLLNSSEIVATNSSSHFSIGHHFSASAIAGQTPLNVTFSIATSDRMFAVDFGDGSVSGPLPADSHISHVYTADGLYRALLEYYDKWPDTSPRSMAIWEDIVIAVGGTHTTPVLHSITPTTGKAETLVTLDGSGFNAANNAVILDNKYNIYSPLKLVDDTKITFTFPSYGTNKDACKDPQKLGGCNPGSERLEPGQHSVVLQNANGVSNSVLFTVSE